MRMPALAVLLFLSAAPAATPIAPPVSFRVEVSGHGRPMIFIPGLSSSGDTWKTTVAHYESQYTCHVLTLAGFAGVPALRPGSGQATDGPLLSTVAEELATYIELQHLEQPIVVGHSLGGNIALDLAARHTSLVGPLVIVDSLPFYAGAWFQAKTVDDAKPMIASMHAYMTNQTREQYEQFVRSGAATKYMVTSPADHEAIVRWGLASDQRAVADAMFELVSEDLRPRLQRVTAPTLLLGTWVGLHDQLKQGGIDLSRASVVKTFEDQYAGLPRMHFVITDAARHFIMLDQPAWFFQQLDEFLANPAKAIDDRGFAR